MHVLMLHLVELDSTQRTYGPDWRAFFYSSGGSGYVYVEDPAGADGVRGIL